MSRLPYGVREGYMSNGIGFVGMGIMGKPMAKNILKAGYSVVVNSRNKDSVQNVVAAGAQGKTSPREVAQSADIIFTMLSDDSVVESIVLGENGLLEGMQKGSVVVDMSTIAPSTARGIAEKLVEKGMDWLDAPVSGGDVGAEEGTLSIMVGGTAETFERVLPVLRAMGKNVSHVGGYGAGQVAKACNQIIVALTIEAVSEALIFAKKSGVDPVKIRDALLGDLRKAEF